MLDAIAIVVLGFWSLRDERRPKGQRATSPFRMLESTIPEKKQDRFQQAPSRATRR